MSDKHVIIGAGPVGRAVADALVTQGSEVLLASRSGAGEPIEGVTRVAVDASSGDALSAVSEGAVALYNCVNPPSYDVWDEVWPPVAAGLLTAAERSGAVLVVAGNLYPYGPVDVPMVEGMPDAATGHKAVLRTRMSADALALHEAGRIRTVEVRGSDYVGTGVGANGHVPRLIPDALQGKTVRVMGRPDQPHTWTDVRDMGRALALAAVTESAWGRIWHAPSNAPRTQAEAVADICRSGGKDSPKVRTIPGALMRAMAPFQPVIRELLETRYQFMRPYVMDSSAFTATFGMEPTPWDEVCRRTAVV